MIPIVLGFVIGFILAAVTLMLLGPTIPGIIVAVIIAGLAYTATVLLMGRERRLAGIPVGNLNDGDKAADTVDSARSLLARLDGLAGRVQSERIRKETRDVTEALEALTRYVSNHEPAAWPTLRHVADVYGNQTARLLDNYLDIEAAGDPRHTSEAKEDTVRALDAVERTLGRELSHALESKTLKLASDSEAIMRLARMDGDTEAES